MLNVSTLEVSGFRGAILGMRNPFKNRDKSDSDYKFKNTDKINLYALPFEIGPKDLELCQKLLRVGKDDDAKFMRMIHVQADVNAPLYWWKEFDTYKVATVANSESTMHTIMKHEFTMEDFSFESIMGVAGTVNDFFLKGYNRKDTLSHTMYLLIETLNDLRERYVKAVERKDPQIQIIWKQLIQLLPSSYMQKRTNDLNYQTLRRIYFARRNHKLDEWHTFCDWIKTLDYARELIAYVPGTCDNVSYDGGSDASN